MKDTYLTKGVTRPRVGALFEVARRFWVAAPWDAILTSDSLLRVSCSALDLEDAVVSVVGQHGEMFGFLLFPDGVGSYAAFEKAAERHRVPTERYTSLVYVGRHDLSVHLRREAERHRWRPSAEGGYPLFTSVRHGSPFAASSTDLDQLEAIAVGLVELIRIEPNLKDATFGIGSFEHTIDIDTFSGPRQLRVSAPCTPPIDDDIVFVQS